MFLLVHVALFLIEAFPSQHGNNRYFHCAVNKLQTQTHIVFFSNETSFFQNLPSQSEQCQRKYVYTLITCLKYSQLEYSSFQVSVMMTLTLKQFYQTV